MKIANMLKTCGRAVPSVHKMPRTEPDDRLPGSATVRAIASTVTTRMSAHRTKADILLRDGDFQSRVRPLSVQRLHRYIVLSCQGGVDETTGIHCSRRRCGGGFASCSVGA